MLQLYLINKNKSVMKKLFLLPLSILLVLSVSRAQKVMSCCQLATMEDYQMLGASADFVRAHAEPLPFTFISQAGGEIDQKSVV